MNISYILQHPIIYGITIFSSVICITLLFDYFKTISSVIIILLIFNGIKFYILNNIPDKYMLKIYNYEIYERHKIEYHRLRDDVRIWIKDLHDYNNPGISISCHDINKLKIILIKIINNIFISDITKIKDIQNFIIKIENSFLVKDADAVKLLNMLRLIKF